MIVFGKRDQHDNEIQKNLFKRGILFYDSSNLSAGSRRSNSAHIYTSNIAKTHFVKTLLARYDIYTFTLKLL